jgi:hypothetical protein
MKANSKGVALMRPDWSPACDLESLITGGFRRYTCYEGVCCSLRLAHGVLWSGLENPFG